TQEAVPRQATEPGDGDANAPSAQRAVLYEEDPTDPAGRTFPGTASWAVQILTTDAGAPETAVRASIAIPDRHLAMHWTLTRNEDKSLPASHTVDLVFRLGPGFPHGGVSGIAGMLMKTAEAARGGQLQGVIVK